MFIIYADSEVEQKQKAQKPKNYRVKNPKAQALFQAGCRIVQEKSEEFQQICRQNQEMMLRRLKNLRIGRENGG